MSLEYESPAASQVIECELPAAPTCTGGEKSSPAMAASTELSVNVLIEEDFIETA
jgi:hypothetical protein